MALTRAQAAAQSGHVSSAPKDQGNRPLSIQNPSSSRTRMPRPQKRKNQEHFERVQQHLSAEKEISHRQGIVATSKRGPKRPIDDLGQHLESVCKRPRRSSPVTLVRHTLSKTANSHGDSFEPFDPIGFWAREGKWPREYFEPKMAHLLARKKSLSSISRKRSNSATSSTPSDQRPREEKSAPYRDARYELLLQTKGTYMDISELGIAESSKLVIRNLLESEQAVPKDTVFDDSVFVDACRNLRGRNEARVIQDISRLIVPSAESLALRVKNLKCLTESVNEGWNSSIPLTGTRPQPDYSLGFKREAFSDDQLVKLSPFIGDFIGGDQSYFMATYYMYFPFLSCEVKCGAAALDVADRQNAHSMTLAVRAVTELFRAVKREDEVHRQILAFSVSHDHSSVRIYGHYPVIEGKDIKYYRHPIRNFVFTELDGKEKWTAYQFTKNVYELWMPSHLKRICSAIDQLPSDLDFEDPSLPTTGLSQSLHNHQLSQSGADNASPLVEQDSQSSSGGQQIVTPSTSVTNLGTTKKKRKGKK
ncbi:hypothetical protein QQS21_010750 [Conoideocrella luteorostrata]|uniref:DUF7924 domain-containing protein n=1 Tax=Conoideocrella luteorostrata TaxID=1105319 RepID=A0AAJ0CFE1_9HYPO|nr:hypothetical protein QQS21_010750 [Conoideocrella luteorostrata]